MPKPYFQSCYRLNFLFGDTEEELRGVAAVSGVRHRGETTDHLWSWRGRDETADFSHRAAREELRNIISLVSFFWKNVVTGQSNMPSQYGVMVLSSLWYLSVLFKKKCIHVLLYVFVLNVSCMPSVCRGILRNCGVIAGCREAEAKQQKLSTAKLYLTTIFR